MNQDKRYGDLFVYIPVLSLIVIMIVFFMEFIEPEQTIQCVSAPCQVPNLTIWEWINERI